MPFLGLLLVVAIAVAVTWTRGDRGVPRADLAAPPRIRGQEMQPNGEDAWLVSLGSVGTVSVYRIDGPWFTRRWRWSWWHTHGSHRSGVAWTRAQAARAAEAQIFHACERLAAWVRGA